MSPKSCGRANSASRLSAIAKSTLVKLSIRKDIDMARAYVTIKELPTFIFVDDYHELEHIDEQFQCIGLSLRVDELGFDDYEGRYVGIVYSGRFPSKTKIDTLIKKFGVKFMD
jgi:hypothetical protein